MKNLIDNFFNAKNIKVSYNTLGGTEELLRAFVEHTYTIVDRSTHKSSQYIKGELYNLFYEVEARKKLTGFEYFKSTDNSLRTRLDDGNKDAWCPTIQMKKTGQNSLPYQIALKNELSKFDSDILLYLSGGLDSEFTAKALLDNEQKFIPVIFRWTDKSGVIRNNDDTDYAFKFCERNNINPIVKIVDIETLWETEEFFKLADDVGTISPHIATHCYVIQEMAKEFPNATHVMGGEARYLSNFVSVENEEVNLVYAAKTAASSIGYNGSTYNSTILAPQTGTPAVYLTYSFPGGGWSVTGTSPLGGPLGGTWLTAPIGAEYRYNVTSSNVTLSGGSISANASNQVIGISTTMCFATAPAIAPGRSADATFTITVWATATPGQTVTTTISMFAEYAV